jgi:hypothetical protein
VWRFHAAGSSKRHALRLPSDARNPPAHENRRFSWLLVDTTTWMSLVTRATRWRNTSSQTALDATSFRRRCSSSATSVAAGIDGQQAFQLLDGQVRLARLRA